MTIPAKSEEFKSSAYQLKLRTGKIVGTIEDYAAIIPVTYRNYLAIGKGYTIDEWVLDQIKACNCANIEFRTKSAGKKKWLRIAVERFITLARRFDFGYGGKFAVDLVFFDDVTPERGQPGVGAYAPA